MGTFPYTMLAPRVSQVLVLRSENLVHGRWGSSNFFCSFLTFANEAKLWILQLSEGVHDILVGRRHCFWSNRKLDRETSVLTSFALGHIWNQRHVISYGHLLRGRHIFYGRSHGYTICDICQSCHLIQLQLLIFTRRRYCKTSPVC